MVASKGFGELWKSSIFLWFRHPLLMFTSRISTQLNREIIKQTHQTCCLLERQSCGERLSLNVLVHKQGEEKQLRHACVLASDRNSVEETDERLGLARDPFIFCRKKKQQWSHGGFDGQTECVSSRWSEGFCALMVNNFSKAVCQTWRGFLNAPWSRISDRLWERHWCSAFYEAPELCLMSKLSRMSITGLEQREIITHSFTWAQIHQVTDTNKVQHKF